MHRSERSQSNDSSSDGYGHISPSERAKSNTSNVEGTNQNTPLTTNDQSFSLESGYYSYSSLDANYLQSILPSGSIRPLPYISENNTDSSSLPSPHLSDINEDPLPPVTLTSQNRSSISFPSDDTNVEILIRATPDKTGETTERATISPSVAVCFGEQYRLFVVTLPNLSGINEDPLPTVTLALQKRSSTSFPTDDTNVEILVRATPDKTGATSERAKSNTSDVVTNKNSLSTTNVQSFSLESGYHSYSSFDANYLQSIRPSALIRPLPYTSENNTDSSSLPSPHLSDINEDPLPPVTLTSQKRSSISFPSDDTNVEILIRATPDKTGETTERATSNTSNVGGTYQNSPLTTNVQSFSLESGYHSFSSMEANSLRNISPSALIRPLPYTSESNTDSSSLPSPHLSDINEDPLPTVTCDYTNVEVLIRATPDTTEATSPLCQGTRNQTNSKQPFQARSGRKKLHPIATERRRRVNIDTDQSLMCVSFDTGNDENSSKKDCNLEHNSRVTERTIGDKDRSRSSLLPSTAYGAESTLPQCGLATNRNVTNDIRDLLKQCVKCSVPLTKLKLKNTIEHKHDSSQSQSDRNNYDIPSSEAYSIESTLQRNNSADQCPSDVPNNPSDSEYEGDIDTDSSFMSDKWKVRKRSGRRLHRSSSSSSSVSNTHLNSSRSPRYPRQDQTHVLLKYCTPCSVKLIAGRVASNMHATNEQNMTSSSFGNCIDLNNSVIDQMPSRSFPLLSNIQRSSFRVSSSNSSSEPNTSNQENNNAMCTTNEYDLSSRNVGNLISCYNTDPPSSIDMNNSTKDPNISDSSFALSSSNRSSETNTSNQENNNTMYATNEQDCTSCNIGNFISPDVIYPSSSIGRNTSMEDLIPSRPYSLPLKTVTAQTSILHVSSNSPSDTNMSSQDCNNNPDHTTLKSCEGKPCITYVTKLPLQLPQTTQATVTNQESAPYAQAEMMESISTSGKFQHLSPENGTRCFLNADLSDVQNIAVNNPHSYSLASNTSLLSPRHIPSLPTMLSLPNDVSNRTDECVTPRLQLQESPRRFTSTLEANVSDIDKCNMSPNLANSPIESSHLRECNVTAGEEQLANCSTDQNSMFNNKSDSLTECPHMDVKSNDTSSEEDSPLTISLFTGENQHSKENSTTCESCNPSDSNGNVDAKGNEENYDSGSIEDDQSEIRRDVSSIACDSDWLQTTHVQPKPLTCPICIQETTNQMEANDRVEEGARLCPKHRYSQRSATPQGYWKTGFSSDEDHRRDSNDDDETVNRTGRHEYRQLFQSRDRQKST
ncbi:uncharacterized protein [Amphiura filiformis]|uniref:uncharacterized protein n=1 Tax=Amphiura filiformis TaxID=82378 RepID=UPI003B2143E5